MAVIDYPDNLPDFRVGKRREQVQTYRTNEPFAGPLFVEKITDESPVTWDVTITCVGSVQARIFQAFVRKVSNSTPFNKNIKTEEGKIAHEVRFIEDPLTPTEDRDIWTYRAAIYAVALVQPDAAIDDDLIIDYLSDAGVIDIAVNIDWPEA